MFYSLHNYFISYAILFAFVLLILVHYLDIQHPNCSFDFSSVEISGSVDCDQGKEQTTNKRFVSLFFVFCISAIHFYFLFLLSFECFHEQKNIPVLGQKVQHNQALKHAGRRLEGTSWTRGTFPGKKTDFISIYCLIRFSQYHYCIC